MNVNTLVNGKKKKKKEIKKTKKKENDIVKI